jgi:hypothetical protein
LELPTIRRKLLSPSSRCKELEHDIEKEKHVTGDVREGTGVRITVSFFCSSRVPLPPDASLKTTIPATRSAAEG